MAIFIFILGTILGSFYLVIATRLPLNEDVLLSRSHCDKCLHQLKWYNLIPLLSYLFQLGKCPYCHKEISLIHFITELITGLSFLVLYLLYGISYEFFMGLIIVSLVIIIFISDFKYMVILDSPLIVFAILSFIVKVVYLKIETALYGILCGVALFCVMLLIEQLGKIIFKREALGGGDIKFGFLIGLILEFRLGLIAIILSTFLALPYSVASLYIIKKDEVPYGPFLAGALLIVFLTSSKFLALFNFLFRI